MRRVLTLTYLLLLATCLTTISCSSIETERVERRVVAYDMSAPLPQNSGIKVRLGVDVEGLLHQPNQDPQNVVVTPGTYVLQGVEVYRRMYALVKAIKVIQGDLTPEQAAAFKAAQQQALTDLDKEASQ